DQQQVDLSVARLEDMVEGVKEEERALAAEPRAVVGDPDLDDVPTGGDPPPAVLPKESFADLKSAAGQHPLIDSYELRARAHLATARVERTEGLPSFSLGADWIITGETDMPGVEDSGKDAVFVGGG